MCGLKFARLGTRVARCVSFSHLVFHLHLPPRLLSLLEHDLKARHHRNLIRLLALLRFLTPFASVLSPADAAHRLRVSSIPAGTTRAATGRCRKPASRATTAGTTPPRPRAACVQPATRRPRRHPPLRTVKVGVGSPPAAGTTNNTPRRRPRRPRVALSTDGRENRF